MIDNSYSIDEILMAVDELNNIVKKKRNSFITKKVDKSVDSLIPKDTLRIIEEAEKTKR